MSLIAMIALTLDYGYPKNYGMHLGTDIFYLVFGSVYLIFFAKQFPRKDKRHAVPMGYYVLFVSSSLLFLLSIINTGNYLLHQSSDLNIYTAGLVFLLTFVDFSGRLFRLNRQSLHPAIVFVLSFGVLILIGTILLVTPNATVNGIGFLDALFTSTSAVCVTGLAVLDTGKDFTLLGQFAILGLIQLGALGMLSFTYLFALFFKGAGSYESRLNLKDMIHADTLDGTFRRLTQIIFYVFLVEGVGAFLVYLSLESSFGPIGERIFFSVFHSVSAFCNAGFSTLSNSLFEEGFRYNYGLHIVIAMLIIFGGLGYGVAINLSQFLKQWFFHWMYRLFRLPLGKYQNRRKPHVQLNTRIVLYTSFLLIVIGAILFYLLELDNSLVEHSAWGKVVTALFGSITTRTAGFNTVDTGALTLPTIMIVLLLMWVGASPGSTGGGIKTTTFAVATLNIIQQVFGNKHIRIGYRRIPRQALQRATTIISLSLIMIGVSTFLLLLFDEELGVMPIAFECFSAFSTVGLSMGITSQLSDISKCVIIITMFVGRVGLLTLLTGIVRQLYTSQTPPIEYPEEDILIN